RRTESMRTASGASSPSWGSEPCEADCQRAVFEVGVSTGLNFDLYRDIRGLVDRRGVAGAVDTTPRPPPDGAGATSDLAPDAAAAHPGRRPGGPFRGRPLRGRPRGVLPRGLAGV